MSSKINFNYLSVIVKYSIITFFTFLVPVIILNYLSFAFVQDSFNPSDWEIEKRGLMTTLIFVITALLSVFSVAFKIQETQDNHGR